MNKDAQIPEIDFRNIQQKAFEFNFISADDLLGSGIRHDQPPFRPHRILFYAILFIMEGEGHHFIDFQKYAYRKGSIIFISKEQVQAFEANDQLKAYLMIFTEKFLERSSLGSNLMQQLSLYNYSLYEPILQLEEVDFNIFSELVLRIKEEFDAPDDFATEEIIQSSLKILLCLAERIRKTKLDPQKQSFYFEEFQQFQQLLKVHIYTSRQVKFYADAMQISTKKLNRITYEIMQQPAKNYIDQYLILEIKRFLMNTALSVKQIAYKTGFEAPTNFVKYFKKYEKMTPAAFRKQY
ncbi:MAG: helix-turn-helix transcriptional regulator [Saprospiraceae bacterium]